VDEDAVDEELRAELLARCDEDQRVRKAAVTKSGHFREIPDEVKEMLQVDEANTAWLAEQTGRVGWPGGLAGWAGRVDWPGGLAGPGAGGGGRRPRGLAAGPARGPATTAGAFLELLRAAVAASEASARELAYLERPGPGPCR